jgi:polar amino acid transport system substrate-binding protein
MLGLLTIFRCTTVLWFFLVLNTIPVFAKIPEHIPICDIGSEIPIYAYYKRKNGLITDEVTGFSVEYIKQILSAQNIKSTVELIPWKRCQAMVANGKYTMLLNASVNPERQKNFLITKAYYTIKDVYFYSKLKPTPKVKNVKDLRLLYICGQAGFNYLNFGIHDEEIDTQAASFPQVMDKLKLGHCDIVLGHLEFAANYRFTSGIDYTKDKDFGWGEIEGTKPLKIHIMVSRQLPYSKELLELINRGIDEMNRSKKSAKLKRKFTGQKPAVKIEN